VFGAGFDSVSATTATGESVHNVLMAALFEGGIVSLVGIVLVLVSAAGTARNAWAMARSSESRRLGAALFAAVGAAITFSMANPILFQRYVWVPVFLAIGLVGRQARARSSASRIQTAVRGDAGRKRFSAPSST
jgi:O-antigen ligase